MRIKTLTIGRRATYRITSEQPENFEGQITLEGNTSYRPDLTINLTHDQIVGVLSVIAPALVAATKASLEGLLAEAESDSARLSIEPTQLIEHEAADATEA